MKGTLEKIIEKLAYEREMLSAGAEYVAGADEVGRGPLAGPVVCAAVILPLEEDSLILGVDDSKKIKEGDRERLAGQIKEHAVAYKICEVSNAEIDRFSTASLINRTTNDVTQIQNLVAMGLQAIVKAPIMAVWAVCKIGGKDWHWTAATAVAVMMVVQLGLEMRPLCQEMSWGLTSGTTSGTSGSSR